MSAEILVKNLSEAMLAAHDGYTNKEPSLVHIKPLRKLLHILLFWEHTICVHKFHDSERQFVRMCHVNVGSFFLPKQIVNGGSSQIFVASQTFLSNKAFLQGIWKCSKAY